MDVIALVVGELTAYLTANKDGWNRDLRDARSDLQSLARDAERQSSSVETRSGRMVTSVSRAFQQVGRDADKQGRDAGGKLARGINQGIVRNSPLIVAGVAAALTAGAPLAVAGAAVLFGGIGAVAAAQSLEVREAWTEMGREIRDGAVADASVLIPALTGMADQLGESFQRLRPQLREAFESTAPLIGTFTDGLTRAADNAMPGLVRAVQAAGPVMDGLADLMADIGAGLTGFFDAMSAHAPAAGQAFAAIGDILAELLPTLGELLGNGAELASVVLPPLAAALGVVADVARALGPALPAIAAGFLAMKVASSVADGVGALGDRLDSLKAKATPANAALGAVGITAGLLTAAMADSDRQTREWADALNEGGEASARARQEMERHAAAVETTGTGIGALANFFLPAAGSAWSIYADDVGNAEQMHQDFLRSTTPLAQAQRDVQVATEALNLAIEEHGPASREAAAAQVELDSASANLAAAERDLQSAIDGVTAAMIEQANQALAAIDSGFAYRHAVDQLEDAQSALNEAIAAYGPGSEEAQRAQLALEEQVYRTALAYGQQQADLSGLSEDSAAYGRLIQTEMLSRLYSLQQSAGPEMAAAIQLQIDALERAGVSLSELDNASASPTLDLDAIPFLGAVDNAMANITKLDGQNPEPDASMNPTQFNATWQQIMFGVGTLNGQRPTPRAGMVDGATPIIGGILSRIAGLAAQRPTPTASVRDNATPIIGGIIARINSIPTTRTTTVTTVYRTVGSPMVAQVRDGGAIGFAGGGSVTGPGGPRDDLIPALGDNGARYRLSNGEHIFDALDVNLMGGQGNVYRFRDLLNRRRINVPALLGAADRQAARGLADGGAVTEGGMGAVTGARTVVYDNRKVYANVDARRLAKAMSDQQRDDEFLTGVR